MQIYLFTVFVLFTICLTIRLCVDEKVDVASAAAHELLNAALNSAAAYGLVYGAIWLFS